MANITINDNILNNKAIPSIDTCSKHISQAKNNINNISYPSDFTYRTYTQNLFNTLTEIDKSIKMVKTKIFKATLQSSNIGKKIDSKTSQLKYLINQTLTFKYYNKTNKKSKVLNKTKSVGVNSISITTKSKLSNAIKSIVKNNIIFSLKNTTTKIAESCSSVLTKYTKSKALESFKYEDIRNDGFIPQGITLINDKFLISSYSKNKKSRIYIYSNSGECEGYIILDNKAHVGGITYDKTNNLIFVSGSNGKVNTYDYGVIENMINDPTYGGKIKSEDIKLTKFDNVYKDKFNNNKENLMWGTKMGQASTLYYSDEYLYVGTFDPLKKGDLRRFKINVDKKNNTIEYVEDWTIKIPRQTQGVAVTQYDNKEYLLTTQSLGREGNKSELIVYELDSKTGDKKYVGKWYDDTTGYEGISINENGEVVIANEFSQNTIVKRMDDILDDISKDKKQEDEINEWIKGLGYKIKKDLEKFVDDYNFKKEVKNENK